MIRKDNQRIIVTLSREEVEMVDKLCALYGPNYSRSNVVKSAIRNYVPNEIDFKERYLRHKGLDPYTLEPLPKEEREALGLGGYWDSDIQKMILEMRGLHKKSEDTANG
jgi:hypothetical protein